jgi:hypothetical protein
MRKGRIQAGAGIVATVLGTVGAALVTQLPAVAYVLFGVAGVFCVIALKPEWGQAALGFPRSLWRVRARNPLYLKSLEAPAEPKIESTTEPVVPVWLTMELQTAKAGLETAQRQLKECEDAEERAAINRLRGVWNVYGDEPVGIIAYQFREVWNELAKKHDWAKPLLEPKEEKLKAAVEALATGFGDNSLTLKEVCVLFNETYGAYADLLRWLAKLQDKDSWAFPSAFPEVMGRWQKKQAVFWHRLRELSEGWPIHRQTMNIYFPFIEDQRFSVLLRPSERTELIDLPPPSGSDSVGPPPPTDAS